MLIRLFKIRLKLSILYNIIRSRAKDIIYLNLYINYTLIKLINYAL